MIMSLNTLLEYMRERSILSISFLTLRIKFYGIRIRSLNFEYPILTLQTSDPVYHSLNGTSITAEVFTSSSIDLGT